MRRNHGVEIVEGRSSGDGAEFIAFLKCSLAPAPRPCAAITGWGSLRFHSARHEGPQSLWQLCWWLWVPVLRRLATMSNLSGQAPFQLHPTHPANSIHCPPPAPIIHNLPLPSHPSTQLPSTHPFITHPLTNPHPPTLHPPCRMESTTHHLHLSTHLLSIHPHPLHRSTNPPIHPSRFIHTLAGSSQISACRTKAKQRGGGWRSLPRFREHENERSHVRSDI